MMTVQIAIKQLYVPKTHVGNLKTKKKPNISMHRIICFTIVACITIILFSILFSLRLLFCQLVLRAHAYNIWPFFHEDMKTIA